VTRESYLPKEPWEATLRKPAERWVHRGDPIVSLGVDVEVETSAVYTTPRLPGLYLHPVEGRPGMFIVSDSPKPGVRVRTM